MGDTNSGMEKKPWFDKKMARKKPYLEVLATETASPRVNRTESIIRPGEFRFQYMVQPYFIQCVKCKEWVKTLSDVKKEMDSVNSAEKQPSVSYIMTEVDVCVH